LTNFWGIQKGCSQYIFPIKEPDKKDKAPIVIKRSKNIKKSELESFFDRISPEIIKTFNLHPELGSIKLEVHFHQGQAVKN